MTVRHLAVTTYQCKLDRNKLPAVAHAWSTQVVRDYAPIWGISATVTVFPTLASIQRHPAAGRLWPVVIMDDIGVAGASGVHEDSHGRPLALVDYDGSDSWTLTGSHEIIEMLTDPLGTRTVAAPSPVAAQGQVNFLIEPCDPSEADAYAYAIDGVRVSDFYLPAFLTGNGTGSLSHTGALNRPRQILPGGYLSWQVPSTNEWWQATYFGSSVEVHNLGASTARNPRRHTNRTRAPREIFRPGPSFDDGLPQVRDMHPSAALPLSAAQLQIDVEAIISGAR